MSDLCQERSGFLFSHGCDWPAQWSCSQCRKPICERHTQMEGPGDETRLCISCAKQASPGAKRKTGSTADDHDASYAYSPYWYTHAYYSGYSSYDADDYAAFDDGSRATSSGDEDDYLGS